MDGIKRPSLVETTKRMYTRFQRREEHTIQLGVVVTYETTGGFAFAVTAHRGGVEVIGWTPALPAAAVGVLITALRRAQIQHEHLATFPVGTKQIALTEDELKVRLDTAVVPPPLLAP